MMRSGYRHMMERIALDDGARARILERLEGARPRRVPRAFKAALIAACVCLALAGTVAATGNFLGIELRNVTPESYTLRIEKALNWPQEAFGAQMAADVAAAPRPESGPAVCTAFAAWDELEDYVGLPLTFNPLLDAGAERFYVTEGNGPFDGDSFSHGDEHVMVRAGEQDTGEAPLYRYDLSLTGWEGGIIGSGEVAFSSVVDGVTVFSSIVFFGRINNGDSEYANYAITTYADRPRELRAERYDMANGTQAQILSSTSGGGCDYQAMFVREGIVYELKFNAPDAGLDRDTIYKVLDAFE